MLRRMLGRRRRRRMAFVLAGLVILAVAVAVARCSGRPERFRAAPALLPTASAVTAAPVGGRWQGPPEQSARATAFALHSRGTKHWEFL